MNYDRTERIRRAAILVASLEQELAEQMLENLPPIEAAKIIAEVDRLGDLDPEEQQDVLDEFRHAGRRGKSDFGAVEFTYSAPMAATLAAPAPSEPSSPVPSGEQDDVDAPLIAELLAHEHPQTIAAALSRLGNEQGAAVFAGLPATLQTDVLDRLANLQPADETAVLELEAQLQRRIEQQREHRSRAAAGVEMARRIVAKTAPTQRDTLLARLSPRPRTDGAAAAGAATNHQRVGQQAEHLESAVGQARGAVAEYGSEASSGFEAWADESSPRGGRSAAALMLEDCSQELEALSDRVLLAALRLSDERTVHRALAASSEQFLQRVAGNLPRRQAAGLRSVVRSLGPTRLIELRQAQHELLRIAADCRAAAGAK